MTVAAAGRASVDIKFKNIDQLRAGLERKHDALQHAGNTYHKAVILIDRWIMKNFESEGQLAYPGAGWQKLAASTIKARLAQPRVKAAAKAKGKAPEDATLKILQQSGWLKSRWKRYWNDKVAIVQSAVDYGIYHDSDEPRKKLPQRKILPTEEQIMPQLMKLFGQFVKTSLSKR